MKLLLNWVYFCMVYSLTHQVTHQNPFGSQVFEDINSPKLSASALPLRKVRKFENVPERRKVRAQQLDNRVSPRFAHDNGNAKRSELKPHLMHTNDKTKLDQPHPEHDHNALWGYKELEHHILKGPTDPPPPSNHTDTSTKQPSLQDLEQHFSSTIRPEHLSFYKWLYKSLDNGRINWYDKVIESLANVNFDPPHLDDVTTQFPVPERHRYLYLYLKQLQHYAKNPTTPHTTRFEEDNLRKKLIAYFGKSFSAEYNKFYKWLYEVIQNVDAAKRRLQFATEQSITAADFDRLVKSTPFQIPTKYRRYFVMVNELERRMSSTNHHYWHTTTPDIYAESSVELSYLREDKRTSIAREEYWQRRYERYYHFTPKPEYEQFYRWFFKENHQLNFPERMKGPVPKVIPMYINPKRDDVTIPSTPFKIPILYTVLFAWLDDKKVKNISTTLISYPDMSLDFTSDWVDSTEEPSTAPTTKYPLITMDPALKEKCESLFHSTIQPWYEQFFSWMWGVNHDESGFYRRNEAYKTYSDFDYSAEMERTLFPIPEHQREYFGYVHAIERILSSTGHHFKLGMTTPMPPQTSTPKTTIERVETTTQETTTHIETTTTKKPRTYPNGSLIPDWERREMLDQVHLEDEIMNFFNMEIEPRHEPYYRWRYLHEMDANRTREKLKIAQNLHDLDFTKLFRYTPFSIPDYHEYQFAQLREAHRHLKAREYPLRNAELTNKLKRYFLIDIPPKYLLFYDWLRDLHTDLKAYYDIVQIGKSLGQINYTQFLQHTPFPIPVVHLKYYAFIKAAEREQYERKMKDLSKEYSTRKMKPERRRRRRRRSIEESHEAYQSNCVLPIPQEISLSDKYVTEVTKPSHNNTIQSECSTLGFWRNQSFSCEAKYSSCPADWYSQWIESTSVCLNDVIRLACDTYQAITEPTDYTLIDITHSTLAIDKIRYDKFNEAFYKMRHSLHEGHETYKGYSASIMDNNRWIKDDQSEDGSFNLESETTEEITTEYKRVKRDIGQYTSATPLHRTVEDDKHMIKKLEHYFSTKIPSLYLQFYHWLYDTQQDEEGFARRLSGFSSLKNQTYNEDNELLYELLNTPFPIPTDQQEYFAFVRRMERYVQSTAHHNKVYVGASTKTAPITSTFGDKIRVKVSDTTPSSIKVASHGYTSSTTFSKEFLENYFHIKISPQYHKYYEWLYEMQQNKDALLRRISAASQIRKNVDIKSILIHTPFPIPEAERSYYAFVQECDRILKSTAHHAKWWGSSTPLVQTLSAFSRQNTPSFENYSHERAGYQQPATSSRLTFHLGRLLKNLTTADERTSRVSSSIPASRVTTETTVPTPQPPHTLIGLKELHEYFTTKIGPYAEFYQWLYELEQDKVGYKNRLKGAKLIHENPSLMDYTKLLKNTPFAIPDNQKQYFAYIYGMDQIIKSTNRYVKWYRKTSTTTDKTPSKLQIPSRTFSILTSTPASRVKTETIVPTPQPLHTLIGLKELHEYFTTKIGPYAEFYQWLYELEQDKVGYKNRLKGAKLVRENPSLLNYTKLLKNTPFAIPDNQKQYFAYIYGMDQAIKSTHRYVKWFRTTSAMTEKITPARQQTSTTYVSSHTIPSTTTSPHISSISTTSPHTIATSFGTKSDNIVSNVQSSISGTRNPYYRTISTTRPKFDYRAKQYTRYSPVYALTDFKRYRTPYRTYNRTRYEYRSRATIRPSTIYTTPDYEKYSKYRTTYYPWIINFTRETNETLKQKLDAYFTTTIIPKYLDFYLWRYKLIHGLITPIMKDLDPIVLANVDFQIHLNNTKFPIPDEGRQIYGYHEVMKRPETITRPLVKGYMKLAKSVATRNYTYPTNDDDIDYYIDYPLTSEDPFSTTQPYNTIDPEEMKKLQLFFSTNIEPAYGEFHKWLHHVQVHEEDIPKRFKVAANLSKEYLADFTYSTPFRVPEIHTAHFIYVNKIEEYMKSTDHHFWRKRSSSASKPTTVRPSLPTKRGSVYTMFKEKDFHRSNILTKQVKPSVVASRSYYRAAPPTYRKQYNWLHNVDKSFKESDERRRISEITPKPTTLSYRPRIAIQTTLRKPPTIYRYRTIASTRTPSTQSTLSSKKESTQFYRTTKTKYKEFEEWLRKIQADSKGFEEREQFIEDVLDANVTVLKSRTPFPIPSHEINYFVHVNEMERLRKLHAQSTTTQSTPTPPLTKNTDPAYRPFYRWLEKIEADPKGVEEREQFIDDVLDVNVTVLKSRTPFPIPSHEINYFVYVNELERLRKLHAQSTTTTTTQSTPTPPPYTKNTDPAYRPFYRWLEKIEADPNGFEEREQFIDEVLDANITVLQSRTPFPIPSNEINYFVYVNELERLRRLHAQGTTTSTTTTQSIPTPPHAKNSAPAYKPFYRWLRKIEADDEGFEDRERFIEMIETNLTVLRSRTPFPIPSNDINFFAYVNELERLRNSTNYVEYTTHAPIYYIKRKYDHHATVLKKQDYHAPTLRTLFSEKFRTHTTTLKTTYDKDFENKVDKYFPFTYSPEYRSFYRWLYRMRHEHDIPLHPKVVEKIAHPDHKFQTPFPIPKDRLYEYAYIEYLRKHNFRSPSADTTTTMKPKRKLDQLRKAKEYFNFSWESQYDEFYIWFYTMIHKESLKDKTCGKILSTPNFEQPYLTSTPFPIPPEYHTHYAMMQYMDNLDSKSKPESQYSDVSDYQVADGSLERQKRQVSYNDINEVHDNEQVEKQNVRRKRHTSKTDNNDENLDEIISRRLNDSKIASRYHLFYKWLRRQLNSNLRPRILSKDPRILQKIDDDLIKKYSKITNSSIPFSDLKNYLYIKLLREELHSNLSSGLTTRIGSLLDDPFKVSFPDYSIEKLKEWWYINKYPNDVDPIYDHFYEWWLAKYHCKRPNTPRWDGPDEISPSYNFTTAKTAFYRIPPKFTHRFAWLHDPIKPTIDFPQTARDLLEKYGVNDSDSDEGPKTTKEFWEYLLDLKKAEKKHDPIYEEFYQWFYKKHYKHPNPFEERGGTTKMEPRLFDELQFTTYRTYKTMKDTPFRIPLEQTDIAKWIADEDFPSTTRTTTLTTPIIEQKRIITKIPTRTTYAPITYRTLGPRVTNKYQLFYSWLDKRFLDAPSSYQKAKIPLVAKSDLEPSKKFKPPKTTPFKIPQDFTNLVEWIDEQQFENEFQKKTSSLDKHSSATENHLEPLNEFVRNQPNPPMNQNVSSSKKPTKTSHKLVKRSAPKYKKSIEKLRKRNERSIYNEENKCPCSNKRNKRSIHDFRNDKIFLTRWKILISKSISFFIPLIQLSIPIANTAQKCCSKKIIIYESESATQVFDFNMYARIQMNLPWIMYSYLVYIYNQNIHGISASPTKVWSTPAPQLSSYTSLTPAIVSPKNNHQFCYDADSYKNLIIQSQNVVYDRENILQNNAMYEEIAWKRRLQEDAAMDKALDRIFTMSPTTTPESIKTDTSLCTSITPLISTTEKSHQVYYDVDNYKRLINQVQNAKEHHDEAPQHNYMYENAPWRNMFQEDVAIYRALNRIFTSRSTNKTTPLFTTSHTYTIPKHEDNSKKQLDAYFSTNINPEFYQAYKWFYNVRIDKEGYLKRCKTPKPLQIDFKDVLKTSPFPLPFHLRHYYAEIREIERAIKSTNHHIPFTRALPTLLEQISFIFTDSSPTTTTESYSAVRRKRHLTKVSNTPHPYTKYEVEIKTPRTFLKPRSHTTISHEVIDSNELYPIDTEELKKFTGTYRRTTAQYTVPFYPTIPLDDPMVFEKLKHFFKFEIEPYYVKFYMWLYRLLTQDEGSVNLDQIDTDSLAPGSRSENDHIQVTNTPFPIPTQYRKVFARIYGEALRKANMSTRAVYTSTYKQTGSTTIKTPPTTVTLYTAGEVEASPSTQETQSRSRKTYNYVTRPRMNWVKGIWVEHLTEGFFDPEFIRRREEYLDQQNAAQRYMTAAKSSGSESTEESFQDPNDDLTLPIITQRTSITINPTSNKQQDNDPPSVEIQNDSDEINDRKKRDLQTDGENFNLSQFSEPPDWLKTISESSSIESPEESSNDDITLPVLTQKTSIKTSHSTRGPNDDSSSIEHESDSEEILPRKKRAAIFSTHKKELTSTTEESPMTTEENSYYDVTHAFDNTNLRRKRAAMFSAPEIKLTTTTEESPSTTEENSYYDVTHAFDNTNLRRKRAAIALPTLTLEPIYDVTQSFDDGKSRRKREARLSKEKAPHKYAYEDNEGSKDETDFYGGDDDDESKDSNDLSSISLANAGNSHKYHANPLKKLSNIPLNSQFHSKNRLVPRHLYPRFLNKISPLSNVLNPLYDRDYIKQEKRIRRSVDSKTSPIFLEISLEKFSTINPRLKPTGIPQNEQTQLEATEINTKTHKGKGGSIKKGKQTSSTLSPSAELFSEVDYFINSTQTMDDYDPFVGDLSDNFFEITNTFAPDDPIIKGDYFDMSESKSRKRRSVKNPDSSSDYSSSESTSEPEPDPNDSDRKFESKFKSYSKPDSIGKFQSKFKSPSIHSDSDDSNRRFESKFKHYKFKPKDDSSENSESKFSLDPHKLAKVIFNNPGRKAVLDLSLKDLRKFSDNVTEPSLEDSDPHLRSKYKQPPYSDESECLQVKHEKAHKTKPYSRNLDGSESMFSLSDAKLAKVVFNNPGRKAVLNLSLKDLRKFSDNITESFSEDSDPHLRSKYKKPPYSDELGLKTTLKPSTIENSQDTEDSNRHFRSKFKRPPYSEDESVLKKKPDPEESESSDSSDS